MWLSGIVGNRKPHRTYSYPRCSSSSATMSLQATGYGVTLRRAEFSNPRNGTQNCSGFPGSIWAPRRQTYGYKLEESSKVNVYAYPSHGVPCPKGLNFPLLVVRYMNRRLLKWTYEPSSLLKRCGRSTTHLFRMLVNIHVGLAVKVLDFVDSWLQFSTSEDG